MKHDTEAPLKPSDLTSLWLIDTQTYHDYEREARKLQAQEMAKLAKWVWRSLVKLTKAISSSKETETLATTEFSKGNPVTS